MCVSLLSDRCVHDNDACDTECAACVSKGGSLEQNRRSKLLFQTRQPMA